MSCHSSVYKHNNSGACRPAEITNCMLLISSAQTCDFYLSLRFFNIVENSRNG